jgi:hypothetical protein
MDPRRRFTRFVKKMLQKEMRYDLMKVGLENPFRFLAHFTVGEKGVQKMLRRFPAIITDDSSGPKDAKEIPCYHYG